MAKLDNIHTKLLQAASLLDEAARDMRDGTRMPPEYIAKIGAAMAEVMMVRHQIYVLRPDLMPAYLRGADSIAGDEVDGTSAGASGRIAGTDSGDKPGGTSSSTGKDSS